MMHRSPTAQAAFVILRMLLVGYIYLLQVHMRLQVELHVDHRRGGARSGAGCPPSES